MLDRWPDEAGRAAYLAGFHAAQAFIYERTGRTVKTHSGVQVRFAELTREQPLDRENRAFLGRTYNLKSITDYETGPDAKVTPDMATEAIAGARRFVAAIVALLSSNGNAPCSPTAQP